MSEKIKMPVTMQEGDYHDGDGLLHCGKCGQPKERRNPDAPWPISMMGKEACACACLETAEEKDGWEMRADIHMWEVWKNRKDCFSDRQMWDWTFEHDNGMNPKMAQLKAYVRNWGTAKANNLGLLLWGNVGTGKTYSAACIANALLEQEAKVRMTNFAAVLNDLSGSFEGRNKYIRGLCGYELLIMDDFGMERGTEYALEQVCNVVDCRYRSGLPLILTTNLTWQEIRSPQDTAHARIYDRIEEMCTPVQINGGSFRRETAKMKKLLVREILGSKEGSE